MRGQWDNEQLLSPSLARSAANLLGGLLAGLALAGLVAAAFEAAAGRHLPALVQAAASLAIPFAIWLIMRILLDMLALHHLLNDKLGAIAEPETPQRHAPHAATGRAADDGVSYPE